MRRTVGSDDSIREKLNKFEKENSQRGSLLVSRVLEDEDLGDGRTLLMHAAVLGRTQQFEHIERSIRNKVILHVECSSSLTTVQHRPWRTTRLCYSTA